MPKKPPSVEDDPLAYASSRLDALERDLRELSTAPKHRRAQVRVNGETEVARIRFGLRKTAELIELLKPAQVDTKLNPEMDPRHRAAGQEVAAIIAGAIPEGHGFALLIFETGKKGGTLSWISNADRGDMLASMREFVARHQS